MKLRPWRREVPPALRVPKPQGDPDKAPTAVRGDLERGEQVLATAREDSAGHWLVLTTWRLLERTEAGQTLLAREWHEVDTGAWNPDLWALSVAFVDGRGGRQWQLRTLTGPGSVPQVFRERTGASVVLVREVDLGPRRTARVTMRKVLRSRELVEQVLLGRGARLDDAELAERVDAARRDVRDQAGLDPRYRSGSPHGSGR